MSTMPRPPLPPLGAPAVPGELPTLDDFREIRRVRCREKTAAYAEKSLAAAVYAEFGDASRPVLASRGLTIRADGTVQSGPEDELDRQWVEIVAAMHAVHGTRLVLPQDTKIDRTTGRVVVAPDPVVVGSPGADHADGQAGGR